MPGNASGPRGDPLVGNLRAFRRDVLGLMCDSARRYGDLVRFHIGPMVVHLVNHPDHIEHILQTHAHNYDKNTRSSAKLRAICGDSLLTTNDKPWQRRRRLMQPVFHRQRIAHYAAEMTRCTAARLEHWHPGQPLDVASEMMRLTYTIVGKTILGADVSPESDAVEHAMDTMLTHTYRRWGNIMDMPDWIPSPGNRRFRRALADVDRVVYRIINEHRTLPQHGYTGLLSMLMEARDEETGAGFSDTELRNETITMLLAGHETTANALTWSFYLLAQHPDVAEQLRTELAVVLAGRVPTIDDLPRLKFTSMVIQESMRLYPPIWAIERRVIAGDVIGGYRIPAGSSIVISPYVLHRQPEYWPEPDRFDPQRFEGDKRPAAYIPFGAGPRYCIGNEFAMMEARLIVAMVMQSFRLTLEPGHPVEPNPCITLRLRHGLRMIPEVSRS